MTQYPLGLRIVTGLSDVKKIRQKQANRANCNGNGRPNGHRRYTPLEAQKSDSVGADGRCAWT